MSNFLTNLARRSFSSATGIRPRLASMFEPARVVPETFPDPAGSSSVKETFAVQNVEVETNGTAEEPNRSSIVTETRAGKIEQSSPYALTELRSEHDSPRRLISRPESTSQATPSRVQQSSSPMPADEATEAFGFAENASGYISDTQEARTQKATVFRSRPEPNLLLTSPTTDTHGDGRLNMEKQHPALTPPRLTVTPGPKSMGRERSKVPAHPLVPNEATLPVPFSTQFESRGIRSELGLTSMTARAKKHSTSKLEPLGPDAEPSIHVTIGRVEVRAELAASTSRAADRPASAVMGLEEYLRRRTKRGKE